MSGFFRMREASSAKATSRTWWLPFSMRQCPRIHSFQHSGGTPAAEDTQKTISLVVCRVRSWDRACRRCARETDRGAPSPGDGKVRIGRRLCIGARPPLPAHLHRSRRRSATSAQRRLRPFAVRASARAPAPIGRISLCLRFMEAARFVTPIAPSS